MLVLAIVAGLIALALAGLVVLDRARADYVAEGIHVDGVDVGGRSAEDARAIVGERVARPLRRTVVATRGDDEFELPPERSRLEVDVEATVDAAVEEGRGDIPGVRAVADLLGLREVDRDLEPRIRYSRDAVESFVAEVAQELDREPRDAEVEATAAGLETVGARRGFETDRDELRSRVVRALEARDEQAVDVPGDRIAPDTTLDNLAERHPHYIVIDRENFRLRYFRGLERAATYRISVGDVGQSTPPGDYDISNKAVNPTWFVPDEEWAGDKAGERIPPGPENPIKARWLGIEDGIGIHGTDETDSIGRRASAGCIRMLIPEVKELYDRVPVGTPVYIA